MEKEKRLESVEELGGRLIELELKLSVCESESKRRRSEQMSEGCSECCSLLCCGDVHFAFESHTHTHHQNPPLNGYGELALL